MVIEIHISDIKTGQEEDNKSVKEKLRINCIYVYRFTPAS